MDSIGSKFSMAVRMKSGLEGSLEIRMSREFRKDKVLKEAG